MKIYVSDWHNNFFDDVYAFVKEKSKADFKKSMLVFSTSRARQLALEYFQKNEKNTLLPECITVQEFLNFCAMGYLDATFANTKSIDTLESIALLYEIVQELAKKEEKDFYKSMLEFELENTSIQRKELESFVHFYSYGQYLDAIIQECFEENSIALSLSHVGDKVDGFALYLLQNLKKIINSYKNQLDKKGFHTVSYKKYRLAQALKASSKTIFENKTIYFCGLDRITGTEDACFKYFANFDSHFIISSDIKLVNDIDNAHWSTSFYQDWALAWQIPFEAVSKVQKSQEKQEYFFHQAFDMHSQFQDFKIEDNSVSIACVLNNPQSLMPLIHSLNPHFEDEEINISMGYPLSESKVFQLFNILTAYKENARMYVNKEMEENIYISYTDFIDFVSFPLFAIPLSAIKKEFLEARNGEELPYINIIDIVNIFSHNKALASEIEKISPLLIDWYNLNTLENLVNFVIKLEKILHDKVYDNALERLALRRLNEISFAWRQKPNILLLNIGYELCLKLLFKSIKDESVPFEHHASDAIQVLGLRETRLLSFDTIHIFDSNDEYLPPKSEENPLLPDNLRFHLGLKSSKMYELYTAHTWHRLVASAKNVHFYWHESSAKGLFDTKKTRSPYVEEALWELERQKGEILKPNGKDFTQAKCIIELPQRELSIPISDNLKEILLDFCKKPLSATRLDSFISCPLKFFYQYISGIKAISEPKEEDNQRIIGNLVHRFMEALYREKNVNIDRNDLLKRYKQEINNFDTYLERENLYNILPAESMLLLKNSFPNKMQKFILSQPEQTKILAKEEKFEANILLKEKHNSCINMKLQGVIDRIDERVDYNGEVKSIILDYKTGSLTKKIPNKTFWKNGNLFQNIEQNFHNFDENMVKNMHNEIFNGIKSIQLPYYIFLTNENNYSIVDAAYVDFYETCEEKSIISKDNDVGKIIDEQIPLLLEFLMLYIQSITTFTRVKNAPCTYCDYKKYCE